MIISIHTKWYFIVSTQLSMLFKWQSNVFSFVVPFLPHFCLWFYILLNMISFWICSDIFSLGCWATNNLIIFHESRIWWKCILIFAIKFVKFDGCREWPSGYDCNLMVQSTIPLYSCSTLFSKFPNFVFHPFHPKSQTIDLLNDENKFLLLWSRGVDLLCYKSLNFK